MMLTLNDGRNELWQWDTGRKLTVDADCTQVHFSNKFFGRSVDVNVVDGTAEIPDVLLQADKDLLVWAFVGTAENGYTKISKIFKVNKRNKPADYVFTPTDQTSLEELIERLDAIEESQGPDAIKNAVENYLEKNPVEAPVQSVNGYTGKVELTAEDVGAISQDDLQEATNEALSQAKESGEFDGPAGPAGPKGDTGDTGPAGPAGPAGKDGQDGYTPVKGVDYFDGQPGKDGSDGKDGADGYTPVKGKDYFDGKDGQDGSPGKDGSNGVSATHSWNGTVLTVTSASGTSSADLKGEKGNQGNPGKTAYAYAREGGYTGTEEQFAAKMAKESAKAFYVTVTDNGDATGTTDRTFEETMVAYEAGCPVIVILRQEAGEDGPQVLGMALCGEMFGTLFTQIIDYHCQMWTIVIGNDGCYCASMPITSDVQTEIAIDGATWNNTESVDFTDTINGMITTKIPDTLRNPNALTINGVSYDGSEAVDMTIEGGGSGNSAPDYVRTEAERLAKVVQARQNENTISAILSSDYHLPNAAHVYHNQILESITHAGQAMGILRNQLSIDFEAKLGDLIWDSGETPEEALANFRLVHSLVSAGNIPDRYEGNGNHDHLQSNSTPLTDSQVYANIGIYNKGCVRDSANRAGGYCYKDYEEYKLRVILLNTSEANDGSFTVSSAQVAWLGEALAVPVEEGWGTLILSHHPLDWGGSSTAVMNKIKAASGIIANLHGHVHTFTQDVITGTEIPRLAIPNVCFYRNNEYGTNGKAENSEGIEFGTTRTYSKTAKTANDTSFCVLTIDRKAGKLYLDHYGAGIDRVEDVPTWGKKGYTNLVPTSEAADSTEPYNGTGYKNGYYLASSSPFEGTDSTTVLTGYIPYSVNTTGVPGTIYIRGAAWDAISHCRLYFFDDTKSTIRGPQISGSGSGNAALTTHFTVETLGENYYKLTPIAKSTGTWVTITLVASVSKAAYMRMSLVGTGENLIVTVNEEIA